MESAMVLACLLPDLGFSVGWIRLGPDTVEVGVVPTSTDCRCPQCGLPSDRVHSHHIRTLQDVPAHGRVIQLQIRLRRFFCDFAGCAQETFAEQVPQIMMRHSRKTCQLIQALQNIALEAGGEAGARLGSRLSMPASPDTLLRLIRRLPAPAAAGPRVLGVDDWAFHRGRRYGTILCDLEAHRPVDLLPERSSSSFAAWLQQHPGVQIISRDRGTEYAKGATLGAPQAKQVADRWHLLHNLIEAFERGLDRHHTIIAQAAGSLSPVPVSTTPQVQNQAPSAPTPSAEAPPLRLSTRRQRLEEARARRRARYEQVKTLQSQGVALLEISRQLHLARSTVQGFARAEQFPERAARCGEGILSEAPAPDPRSPDPLEDHLDYLKRRWEEGCHNAMRLYREVKERGFTGLPYVVKRRVAPWRKPQSPASRGAAWRPSGRTVAWLLLKPNQKPTAQQAEFLKALLQVWPSLAENVALIEEFRSILCGHHPEDLESWAQLTAEPSILGEIHRFAQTLRQDWAAVLEAASEPWSNGQVEGQVNRLKLIKRLMYGRANFDLLRQRVLLA
jgi:transposase